MGVRTLLRYLIGDREAILALAANRQALWVGLLFVLSAGFAREYDGQYLVREPWHLLIPLGASLISSFLLFLLTCGTIFLRAGRPPFRSTYRSFLTLFWMTAPLAWLYAIPFERLLSPADAVSANLLTLAFVAIWRVALMTWVVTVVANHKPSNSILLVLAFADGLALAAMTQIPKPIIAVMGGVQLSEAEAAVNSTSTCLLCLAIPAAPFLGVAALSVLATAKPRWTIPIGTGATSLSRTVWTLAIGSVAVWALVLPCTQREQQLRWKVERQLLTGHVGEALDLMSAQSHSDFPPHWDPLPRIAYRQSGPSILDVIDTALERDSAPWVRSLLVHKLQREYLGSRYSFEFRQLRGTELSRVARILRQVPEGPLIAAEYGEAINWLLNDGAKLSTDERRDFEAILKLAMDGSKPR